MVRLGLDTKHIKLWMEMFQNLTKSFQVLSPQARLDKVIQKIKKLKYPMVSYLQILKLLQVAAVLSLSYQQYKRGSTPDIMWAVNVFANHRYVQVKRWIFISDVG